MKDSDSPPARGSLRALLVENSEMDALLVVRELQRAGYDVAFERIDTADALAAALQRPFDVITCDWLMPAFGAPEALRMIAESGVDVPVIIVSGEVGEEYAVTAMKFASCCRR